MKSDERFSDMSNKTILIDCLNENVIHTQSTYLELFKTLVNRGFFFGEVSIKNNKFRL